jgi:hypothetical protein
MKQLGECKIEPRPMRTVAPSIDEDDAREVISHLEALGLVQEASKAPKALTRDLELLVDLLRSGDGGNDDSRYLLPMLNALRQALMPKPKPERGVREFIERLKAETGSDRFDQTLSELANSGLRKEDLVEIARAVYGGIPKRTSRKAALAFIRKPHDAYMSARRGIEATGGRSAA